MYAHLHKASALPTKGPLPRATAWSSSTLHNTIEVEHFRVLWEAIVDDHKADSRRLIEAARLEVWEHITFWDDAYSAILEMKSDFLS
jgi:hypothetical protein